VLLLDLSKNTLSLNLIYPFTLEQYNPTSLFNLHNFNRDRDIQTSAVRVAKAKSTHRTRKESKPNSLPDGFRKDRCAISGDQVVT
jgi:hypothetical protein